SSVSLCHRPQYVRLMKFLHKRGFTSTLLQPARFTGTTQFTKTQDPGELLISLPESCLLTSSTVLDSYLGECIKRWKPRLSPLLVLCVFLVCERHRGEASDWSPYIEVLPAAYTCPAYFTDDVMAVLPESVRRRASEQRRQSLQPILSQPVKEVLTYEALRWAWCSVNTRSVFMSHPSNPLLSGHDVYALAPFLDLLNHRPDVQVQASFNEATRCYEIRSVSGTHQYKQAFINYGSHDNQRLMLEYGFVASDNPHSVVYVDTGELGQETGKYVWPVKQSLDQKIRFLRENNFLHNLTVSCEGPSWRLMTALRLLTVLLGQAVCEDREQWSVQTAITLCHRLLQDTHKANPTLGLSFQTCVRIWSTFPHMKDVFCFFLQF
uniref:SET domain containing 4 n=1 Tax=Labrus bergylta TaxID=56723 RepID=A0A3Q3GCH7_9LABR